MDRKRPTPEGDGRMHMEGTSNTVSYGRGKKTLVHLSICPWLFVHARSSIALWCCSFLVLVCAPAFASLDTLERQVHEDLKKLNIPGKQWTRHPACFCGPPPLDVAIIGSGMAGNTVALALAKEGIVNIRIFDANPEGNEGSWNTYARMKQLRSNKRLAGPSAGIPSLTFRAWYLATRGHGAWEVLGFIPTGTWGDYLRWYRKVLRLPVANEVTLKKITPHNGWLELTVEEGAATKTYLARKVVLATGMEGFGGNVIPPYMSDVPKNFYATAYEPIAPACLKEKRIAVIGAGASAFDATAFALENGAHRVDMMVRRKKIPLTDKFSQFSDRGIQHGFYSLSDDIRCRFFAEALSNGTPPPHASMDRVSKYPNFHVHLNTEIKEVIVSTFEMLLRTDNESYEVDFIILATGFAIDGTSRQELQEHMPAILLWEEKAPEEVLKYHPKLGKFPYLGPHFQFLESRPGEAPYLKNIYCFNYGAFLSHGLITCNISGISIGADRLARGIATDFLTEDAATYFIFQAEQ